MIDGNPAPGVGDRSSDAAGHAAAPTRIRYRVLALVCLLSMITYLDRVCFGAAAPLLVSELSLGSVADLKWAFTAFAIAYAVFEIPSGWLGDTLGPRGTLLRIVVWWSLCTALTGAVGLRVAGLTLGGLGTLAVLRFLFGAGEAGAYPNITRAVHNWFPVQQRATAQGFVWMSGRLMGGLTPLVWTVLVFGTEGRHALMTWREAFVLLGAIGLMWCVAFGIWFRNHPREDPRVNAGELAETQGSPETLASHGAVPWRTFLRSGNLWWLCIMYFCVNVGWSFNITYLPSYLRDRYDLADNSKLAAIYKGGPLWVGAVGCLAGGFLADWLIRRMGNLGKAKRRIGTAGQALAALCWCAAFVAPNVHVFCVAVSAAAFCNDLTIASAWSTCQDIGQRHAAVTAACMNTVGTFGSAAAVWFTGTLMEWSLATSAKSMNLGVGELPASAKRAALLAGYDHSFLTYAAAYALSAVCWTLINPAKPIVAPADDGQRL